MAAGAIYVRVRPVPVNVPCAELPFNTPFTYQFRAVLVVLLIVAVNSCAPPIARVLDVGLRVTAIVVVTVTLAVLFFPGSAALATLMTAGLGLGTLTAGAVYRHVRGATLVQAVNVP